MKSAMYIVGIVAFYFFAVITTIQVQRAATGTNLAVAGPDFTAADK